MEKKKEVRYSEGSIVVCPCGKGYCVAADVKLLKTRQAYSELEIIPLKKVLTKLLKVSLEESGQ